jgi:hypothetical protein
MIATNVSKFHPHIIVMSGAIPERGKILHGVLTWRKKSAQPAASLGGINFGSMGDAYYFPGNTIGCFVLDPFHAKMETNLSDEQVSIWDEAV